MNEKNIKMLFDFIVFSKKIQTGLMIAKYKGINIDSINIISEEEQRRLNEAIEILGKEEKRIKTIILNQ